MDIQFGCCLSISGAPGDGSGFGDIVTARNAGFDYAELSMAQITSYTDREFSEALSRIRDISLPCRACNCFLPASLKVTGPNVDYGAVDRYVGIAVSRGDALGVETVVFGSGGARMLGEGVSPERGFVQLVEFLRRVSSRLEGSSMKIAIEHLNSAECNIINTLAEGAVLARAVDRPNIGVLFDYYHMGMEGEPLSVFAELKNGSTAFFHGHIANPSPDRGFPLVSSVFEDFASAVRGVGYTGKLSIEGSTKNLRADGEAALGVLRGLFND